DLVVVNLYPFAETAEKFEKGKAGFDELIENIDIGGPTLIRAAAKNYQDVLVVVDPADYPEVATQLSGEETVEFRFEMAKKAFGHIAVYDVVIAETLMGVQLS
ncbi:MAG TPA: bifunctional phosphoribosylaminoimidazolecarboxamide formyltransferase/IMP cyclohydrolase, partial [Methylomirabilota bacterium]|nr:bifunctional phosphoribosylaminoimidazolecarboxamide formyltransferase/IMP cyclohydrolase [Methylomirabilota bacterium]